MEGEVESWLEDGSALEVEQRFRGIKKIESKWFSELVRFQDPIEVNLTVAFI